MKTYLYYATEENGFECDKFETTAPILEVKQFLQDDYLQTDEIESAAYEMSCKLERNGFAIYRTENGQGYHIIIGIARYGKCHEIKKVIADSRREFIAENF